MNPFNTASLTLFRCESRFVIVVLSLCGAWLAGWVLRAVWAGHSSTTARPNVTVAKAACGSRVRCRRDAVVVVIIQREYPVFQDLKGSAMHKTATELRTAISKNTRLPVLPTLFTSILGSPCIEMKVGCGPRRGGVHEHSGDRPRRVAEKTNRKKAEL